MISVGFDDSTIHPSYKCRIVGKSGTGAEVAVKGLLSEGYNLQSSSNYGQPMLDFSAGQKLQAIGAVTQEITGMSSQTLSNSIQVYENETPITITLPLSFMALRDPLNEVSMPVRYLMEMKAPQLSKGALLESQGVASEAAALKVAAEMLNPLSFWNRLKNSRRPNSVNVFISRHIMIPGCLISDVEVQDESVNHKSGLAMQKVVNVTIVFQRAYNSSEFASLFLF